MSIVRGPNIVRDGLILHVDAANEKSYPETDTTWFDLSGNNYDGTIVGNPNFSNSNLGIFEFDGTDDVVNISSNLTYPSEWTDAFTLEVWLKVDSGLTWNNYSGARTNIIGRGSYGGSFGIVRTDENNEVAFFMRSDNTVETKGSVVRDKYHNIVAVWDGSSLCKLFINGELSNSDNSFNYSSTPDVYTFKLMGNVAFLSKNGGYGAGDLPVAKIYNKALTENEVQQNFNALKGRFGL